MRASPQGSELTMLYILLRAGQQSRNASSSQYDVRVSSARSDNIDSYLHGGKRNSPISYSIIILEVVAPHKSIVRPLSVAPYLRRKF